MDIKSIVDIDRLRKEDYIFKGTIKPDIFVDQIILNDMEIYNEVDKQIPNNKNNIDYINKLAKFRNFDFDFLSKKNIIYADGYNVYNSFPWLKYTTLAKTDNNFMDGKYLLPIRLINNNIFTFMSYTINAETNRYTMPAVRGSYIYNYSKQGQLLGNLQSIEEYSGDIYFAEGFFDAYRINESMDMAGVAILGSSIGRNKYRTLKELKRRLGRKFIYVPDFDDNLAGTSEDLLNLDIWDRLFNFNKEFNSAKPYKDIDQYFRFNKE